MHRDSIIIKFLSALGVPLNVSPTNPLPVALVGALAAASFTDRSGAITLGGTSQVIAAAGSAPTYFFFQNTSDTIMWLNFGVAAVAASPSISVPAGATYAPAVWPSGSVNLFCAVTGKTFTFKTA